MQLSRFLSLTLLISLGACSSVSKTAKNEPFKSVDRNVAQTQNAVCAEENDHYVNSDGDSVILCQKLYSSPPYIRVADEDHLSDPKNIDFIAAIHTSQAPDGMSFIVVLTDRNGNQYTAVDSSGAAVAFDSGKFDKRLQAPTYRTLFMLYHVQGQLSGSNIKTAVEGALQKMVVTSVAPYLMVDGCAMDSFLLGTWEGDVSQRLAAAPASSWGTAFDPNTRIPISITFTKNAQELGGVNGHLLPDWLGKTAMKDGVTTGLVGNINNWNQPTRSASGDTIPALSSYSKENPFLGAKNASIIIYRLSNMHGGGYDDHWVVQYPPGTANLTLSGMTVGLEFFHPGFLF